MKKILFITNHSYMFWQFRRELVQELLKEYAVTLLTPFNGHEHDFEDLGCKVIETKLERRGIDPLKEFRLFSLYQDILKEEKPDYVITYSIKPNIYAGIACSRLHIPYAVNVQGLGTAFQKNGLKQAAGALYGLACKSADVVFFENQANADYFISNKIVNSSKVTVLPGAGVNTDYYRYEPFQKHDHFHFLYLGRIMKEKGADELLQAVREIFPFHNAVLDIVGFYEEDYEEKIKELTDNHAAVFHGFQTDPRPYYAMADCVVLPSYHEGMSNVLLEAASTGRIVITSDIPGCREAVNEGKTGFLCTVKDVKSLKNAMLEALSLSSEQMDQMSKLAREKMINEFDKYKVIEMTRTACRL